MSNQMGPDEPKLPLPLTDGDSADDGETVATDESAEGATAEEGDDLLMNEEKLKPLLDKYLINPESRRNNYIYENLFKLRENLKNNPGAFNNLIIPRDSNRLLLKFLKGTRKPEVVPVETVLASTPAFLPPLPVAPETGTEGKPVEEGDEQPMSLEELKMLIRSYLLSPDSSMSEYIREDLFKLLERLDKPGVFENLITPRDNNNLLFKFLKNARKPVEAKAEIGSLPDPAGKITDLIKDTTRLVEPILKEQEQLPASEIIKILNLSLGQDSKNYLNIRRAEILSRLAWLKTLDDEPKTK